MTKNQDTSLIPIDSTKPSLDLTPSRGTQVLKIPSDVKAFLVERFSDCNKKIAFQLSTFPNAHEEALDLLFISYFAVMQGAIKFDSNWTLRLDAHFIGGGRHYRTWEVADIGLMVIFRRNGKIIRSKLTFLQSKKLFASSLQLKSYDPYHRHGMGRLLVTDDEHLELVRPRLLKYSELSKYKAFKIRSEQEKAMNDFSRRYKVPLHYLFYNPCLIPWQIQSPVEGLPEITENKVGCRIIAKAAVDKILKNAQKNSSPSYKDLKTGFVKACPKSQSHGGWRLERFICDLFIGGSEGVVDDSPNFELMTHIMTAKSSPISSALSITFDFEE
jgi:hypothetical protein